MCIRDSIGILIEEHSGKLPFWLAPVQVVVASIISDANEMVTSLVNSLRNVGVRVETDIRNEKINYKVREHSLKKVPIILALGNKEVENQTVTVRRLGEKNTEILSLTEIINSLKTLTLPPDLR